MDLIKVDISNIEQEHICCAMTEKKGEVTVSSKKAWLRKRFDDGLVFLKLNVRGKVFIEYMPAETCFAPITAPGYMYINCFWVSGKFKGNGYANVLLRACIEDAKSKGKKGLVVLGSKKKLHFLTDPSYLKYKGFKVCSLANPNFELLYLPFGNDFEIPRFNKCALDGTINNEDVVIYYSNGCPHTEKYVELSRKLLEERHVSYTIEKVDTVEEAKNSPTPFTIYSLFIKGQFVTTEVLTEKKLSQYLDRSGL